MFFFICYEFSISSVYFRPDCRARKDLSINVWVVALIVYRCRDKRKQNKKHVDKKFLNNPVWWRARSLHEANTVIITIPRYCTLKTLVPNLFFYRDPYFEKHYHLRPKSVLCTSDSIFSQARNAELRGGPRFFFFFGGGGGNFFFFLG